MTIVREDKIYLKVSLKTLVVKKSPVEKTSPSVASPQRHSPNSRVRTNSVRFLYQPLFFANKQRVKILDTNIFHNKIAIIQADHHNTSE